MAQVSAARGFLSFEIDLVDRPEGMAEHWDELPPRPGQGRLRPLAVAMLRRFGAVECAALAMFIVACFTAVDNPTSCSETDRPILVWRVLQKAFVCELGVALVVSSTFACEKEPTKQCFLRTVWRGIRIIPPLEHLCKVDSINFGQPHLCGQENSGNWQSVSGAR